MSILGATKYIANFLTSQSCVRAQGNNLRQGSPVYGTRRRDFLEPCHLTTQCRYVSRADSTYWPNQVRWEHRKLSVLGRFVPCHLQSCYNITEKSRVIFSPHTADVRAPECVSGSCSSRNWFLRIRPVRFWMTRRRECEWWRIRNSLPVCAWRSSWLYTVSIFCGTCRQT